MVVIGTFTTPFRIKLIGSFWKSYTHVCSLCLDGPEHGAAACAPVPRAPGPQDESMIMMIIITIIVNNNNKKKKNDNHNNNNNNNSIP